MNIRCIFLGHLYRPQFSETFTGNYTLHHGSFYCYRCGKADPLNHVFEAAERRQDYEIGLHNREVERWQAKRKTERKQKIRDFHRKKRNG